jgi:diguanylate cyclase (GGDEF)-like protein/PAS domain S-box-containing protein
MADLFSPGGNAALEPALATKLIELLSSHTRQLVVFCDAQRRVRWVNPAFELLTGYRLADVVGRKPAELLQCPETDPRTIERVRQALGRGEGIRVELLNQARGGRRYWIDADISPVRDGEGQVCGYVALQTDVTEQVHLRNRLQALFEGASTGLVMQDSEGRITDANRQAQHLLGLTREQLMGRESIDPRWRAVHEDLSPFPADEHPSMQTLRDGHGRRGVVMGVTAPAGERRWLQINSELVPAAQATERAVVTSFVDITQRKRNDEILAEAIEAIPDGFVVYDELDRLLICNSAYRRTYALSAPAMVPGVSFEGLIRYGVECGQYPQAGTTAECREAWIAARMDAHRCHDNELLLQLAGNRWVQIRERRTPAGYTVGVRTDVTDLKRTQQALLTSQSKLQSLFNLSPVGIVLNRLDNGSAVECNDALLAMLGYRRDELDGMAFWTVTPPEYLESEYRQLASLHATGRYGPYEKELIRKDGSRVPVLLNGMCLEDSDGGMLIWSIVQDISARKAMERELSIAARTDRLTGLANRTALSERVVTAVRDVKADPSRRFSLLFLDFDRFKLVNDSLGHHAGDRLLCEIARRLRLNLRASDFARDDATGNVVARLGGDEFVLLLCDARDAESAQAVARRVIEALAPAYLILGHEVYSSASIGIALADEHTESADSLLRDADIAMYEAKHAGRACAVVFNEQMRQRLTRRIELENGLRRALGTGQLTLVYQPIVDLESGDMVSVEALARWRHPELGPISPAEFIPVAEETGLIQPLGEWVLRESCRQFMAWRREAGERAPRTISVNLSRVQMNSPDQLRALLRDVLARNQMQADWLQLEVTEREVMRDPQASRALMQELRDIGVRLAMDDFGTGTSSLGCLREFPFDTIKIDRSFLGDLESNRDVLALVHATMTLLENLGLASVAEGVETAAQVAVLQSLGCRYAQGYYLSRPVAADALLDCLRPPVQPAESGRATP